MLLVHLEILAPAAHRIWAKFPSITGTIICTRHRMFTYTNLIEPGAHDQILVGRF